MQSAGSRAIAVAARKRLTDDLRRSILRGDVLPGQVLPTETQLMESYGLTRHSVRAGLGQLVAAGLISRAPGRGSVVCRQIDRPRLKEITLVMPDPRDWFSAGVAWGLLQALDQNCSRLTLLGTGATRGRFDRLIDELVGRQPDGAVVCPPSWMTNREWAVRLKQAGLPFVVVGPYPTGVDVDAVEVDNRQIGLLAGHHLLECGYRRVYFLTADQQTSTTTQRLGGLMAAVAAAADRDAACLHLRYPATETPAQQTGGLWEASEAFWLDFAAHLGPSALPAGVFTDGGIAAYGVCRACRRLGLNVPDEIGVVGVDDGVPAVLADPALTTIRQRPEELGRVAAELVLNRMEHPAETFRRVTLPVELVTRGSTRRQQPIPPLPADETGSKLDDVLL